MPRQQSRLVITHTIDIYLALALSQVNFDFYKDDEGLYGFDRKKKYVVKFLAAHFSMCLGIGIRGMFAGCILWTLFLESILLETVFNGFVSLFPFFLRASAFRSDENVMKCDAM